MLWVIILHKYNSLIHQPYSRWDPMMLQNTVKDVWFNLLFIWCKSPTLQTAKAPHPHHHHTTEFPPYFMVDTGSCSSFTNSSPHIDPSDMTERFRTLILLSSLCMPWPNGAFLHCFASSNLVPSQLFSHIVQLDRVFSSLWMLANYFDDIGPIMQ